MRSLNKFPYHIFIILQKCRPCITTSNVLTSNHYLIKVDVRYASLIATILKNELTTARTFLVEHSCIDSNGFFDESLMSRKNPNKKSKEGSKIYFNMFYTYDSGDRLTVYSSLNKNQKLKSVTTNYENAGWMERESSEMFQVPFVTKKDVRNLLLDYPKIDFPMLKSFPTEGDKEIYFDIFEDQVQYIKSETIEI